MNGLLSDIYSGNYSAIQRHNRKGTQFSELLDKSNEYEATIKKHLPESMQSIFEQYIKANADLSFLACEEDFISGFRLGTQLILIALDRNTDG